MGVEGWIFCPIAIFAIAPMSAIRISAFFKRYTVVLDQIEGSVNLNDIEAFQ